jgi:predicted GIY-YIG superfamily endonuclease
MFVYFIQVHGEGAVKIGVAQDVDKRLDQLQTANHNDLRVLKTIKCKGKAHAYNTEKLLHGKHKKHHLRGEWFHAKMILEEFDELEFPDLIREAKFGIRKNKIMKLKGKSWTKKELNKAKKKR